MEPRQKCRFCLLLYLLSALTEEFGFWGSQALFFFQLRLIRSVGIQNEQRLHDQGQNRLLACSVLGLFPSLQFVQITSTSHYFLGNLFHNIINVITRKLNSKNEFSLN